MPTDVSIIYKHLCSQYPINLSSSLALGYKSNIDFPVLHGQSVLGTFELYYDDISFAFYAMHDDGKVFAHQHLQTLKIAEQVVADFMEGKLTLVSFGQPYHI